MELNLKNKRALVCGASQGLGFAVAKSLAREGCHIILCARNREKLDTAAKILSQEYGAKPQILVADLSKPEQRASVIKQIQEWGRLDILVNNVGGPAPSTAVTTNQSEWALGFQQLFLSATELSQAFVPAMVKNKFGRIITITSISVVEPIDSLTVSTSMRAAVTGFHKTLATEVAQNGVTVNTVMPGMIHTDRIEFLRNEKAKKSGTTLAEEMDKSAASIPAKRLGRPDELGDLVCFLASENASYITGQNIAVDGGLRKAW